jgi:hypothetical protein
MVLQEGGGQDAGLCEVVPSDDGRCNHYLTIL